MVRRTSDAGRHSRLIALGWLVFSSALAQEKVSFNEHIRPILSDNCFACHGKDAAHREARLRLDPSSPFWHRVRRAGEPRAIRVGIPDDKKDQR